MCTVKSMTFRAPLCIIIQHCINYRTIRFNPLNVELNPIFHLLALLEGATIVDVSGLSLKYFDANSNGY